MLGYRLLKAGAGEVFVAGLSFGVVEVACWCSFGFMMVSGSVVCCDLCVSRFLCFDFCFGCVVLCFCFESDFGFVLSLTLVSCSSSSSISSPLLLFLSVCVSSSSVRVLTTFVGGAVSVVSIFFLFGGAFLVVGNLAGLVATGLIMFFGLVSSVVFFVLRLFVRERLSLVMFAELMLTVPAPIGVCLPVGTVVFGFVINGGG